MISIDNPGGRNRCHCHSSSTRDTSEGDLKKVSPQKRERDGLVLAAVGSVSILSFMDN